MNRTNYKQPKTEYLTLLSVISAIAVVCLHTNGCFWGFSAIERYWFTANIIESLFYFAVPVFFMISGAALINYRDRYSTKQYAVKRIRKTVIPFVIWSLIALAYNVLVSNISVDDLNMKEILNRIFASSLNGVYWFFLPLFCVYLCIPLLSAVSKEARKEVFSYLAVACFGINCLIPFIINVFGIELVWPFFISVGSDYLLYVIVGYLLNEYDLTKRGKLAVYICSLLGLLMLTIGTYRMSVAAGYIVNTYREYNNVPCIMYSVGIFVFFKDHGRKLMLSFAGRLIRFLGDYTFGVYLIHMYILEAVQYFFEEVLSLPSTSVIYRLGGVPVIIIFAVIIISLLRKIPVVKNIVPL